MDIIRPYFSIKKDCAGRNDNCFTTNAKTLTGQNPWITLIDRSRYLLILKDGTAISIWSAGNDTCR